jgi:hypothetical protein
MSTFYLFPARPVLGARFAEFLDPLTPGLRWTDTYLYELAGMLESAIMCHPDVFVVFREELPEGESTAQALADGFGAEPYDEVIEIRAGRSSGQWTTRRWRLDDVA